MSFKVISSVYLEEFEKEVNELLEKGFTLDNSNVVVLNTKLVYTAFLINYSDNEHLDDFDEADFPLENHEDLR